MAAFLSGSSGVYSNPYSFLDEPEKWKDWNNDYIDAMNDEIRRLQRAVDEMRDDINYLKSRDGVDNGY